MKQTIKSLVLVAIAALGIAGCEDVPAPFVEPGTPETPNIDGGTWDNPFTVSEAIANQTNAEVWVHGYIVGSIPESASSTTLSNMTFTAEGANYTNLCIADAADETNYAKCAPVQLPSGSDARTKLNLKENPGMLGKEVWFKATATKYCGAPGLKEVSVYTLTAPTAEDDKSNGGNDNPIEGAKGDGSLENPFNAAAALNYTSALPADQSTTQRFYIKGIVCESDKLDISVQYNNATFHISEDGTASGAQFLIFRTKGLNGAKITSADDIQVGDEVVVYAQLVNYKGNTPETVQGEGIIYSQKRNGQDITTGDEGGDEGDEGDDTPSSTEGNIIENGDFELWDGNTPINWTTASTAGNATLSQSSEARNGSYAVSIGYKENTNTRMGYKEITLPAGKYKFSLYAKGTEAGSKCQTRLGYVPVKNGSAGTYSYGAYLDLSTSEWTEISHEFTLTENTTLCLVMMSPKGSNYHTSQNILVDDASLVKVD